MTSDQTWDDNAPMYRLNWRDRRDMAARKAREAAVSDADDREAPGQGSEADEAPRETRAEDDMVDVFINYGTRQPYAVARAILADPGPLLAALPDDAIEAECVRRFYPVRYMKGTADD